MINSYYSDEEVDYYHDRLQFYADQVASKEITLAQVPRQLLLDSAFFDRVFFLVTGNRDGIDLYQKKTLLQSFIDGRQGERIVRHCQVMVSDSSIDSVR
jgi:hypothetical protein